jgi:uncharacterized membrane protein HdeD (DUF308 family)
MTANNVPEIKTEPTKQMNGGIATGILLVVLGIAAIFLPFFSTVVIETWIGLILASAGVSGIVYAIQTRTEDGFIWKLLLGGLYIATGILLFVYPLTGVLTLTLLLGSFLLTEGVFETILAFKLKPQPNWGWVLANGLLTIAFGAIVWFQWPSDSAWLIGTVVGASVLSTGIARIGMSLNHSANNPVSNPEPNPANNPAS